MSPFTEQDIQQARQMLRHNDYEDDIIAALTILESVGAVDAVPDMMVYVSDKRPAIRSALESALIKIGQDAIPAIVEYLPKLEPEHHVSLQSLVELFWKDAGVAQIHRMMHHEDNRVRWAMAWTLAKPLQTIPPENIEYVFEGLEDESVTAIRWAATQSLTALAHSSDNIPTQLITVALPVMVDNFKYGDVNLSESSVQAIALLIKPPNPAITAMLTSSDAQLQVAAVKVLTAWVENDETLDDDTLTALKTAVQAGSWQLTNEVSRFRYVLSISHSESLKILDDVPDTSNLEDDLEATDNIRATGTIMLPPMETPLPEQPDTNET